MILTQDVHTHRSSPARAVALLLVAGALVWTAVCAFGPEQAQAYFDDVASEYGSSTTLEPNGDVVDVSDIPDGEYEIGVQSSSARFAMPSDVVLTVEGGSGAVSFTLSSTYTYIYLGTAKQAASLSGEDGTDGSPYIAGTSSGSSLRYSIGLSQLNVAVNVAMYNGGKRDAEEACWYDRQLLFETTDEINLAIASESLAGSSGGEEDSSASGGDGSASGGIVSSGDGSDSGESGSSGSGGSSGEEEEELRDTSDVNLSVDEDVEVNDREIGKAIANAQKESDSDDASDDDVEGSGSGEVSSEEVFDTIGMIPLTVKTLGLDDSVDIEDLPTAEGSSEEEESVSVSSVAIAALVLLVVGALLRIVTFGAAGGFSRRTLAVQTK